jgi:hypothetical protein
MEGQNDYDRTDYVHMGMRAHVGRILAGVRALEFFTKVFFVSYFLLIL